MHSIWGASLPKTAPLQMAGFWGLDLLRWSTDRPSYRSGSHEEAAELQSPGGGGTLNKDPEALLQNHVRNTTWPLFSSHV